MADDALSRTIMGEHLCLLLMRKFRRAVPGVRLGALSIAGYTGRDVKQGFRYLKKKKFLRTKAVHDVLGNRFSGYLVSVTPLGQAVLDLLEDRSARAMKGDGDGTGA